MGIFQAIVGTAQHNVVQWQPKAQHGCCAIKVVTMSWESHPGMVLTQPPPLCELWLDGSIIIPLCRSLRTCCHASFGCCSLSLGVQSAAYVKILLNLFFEMYSFRLTVLGCSSEFFCLLPHMSWGNASSHLVAAHCAFAQAFMCDIVSHLGLRSSTSCWPPLAWTLRHRAESCRFILVRLYRGRYLKYWYLIFKEQWRGFLPPHNICRWEGVFNNQIFEKNLIF